MADWFSIIFRYKDKKSPDKLGRFPQFVNIEAYPERRYLWTSRILVICSVASICFTIILAMTIYVLLPLRGAYPRFYSNQNFDYTLQRVEAQYKPIDYQKLLTEKYIRRYIDLRHSLPENYAELYYRWIKNSEFYQFSSIKAYNNFIYKMDNERISKLIDMEITRKIDIKWVRHLTSDLWVAHFAMETQTAKSNKKAISLWNAYIRVYFKEYDIDTPQADYAYNPFGFKVKSYSVGYVGDGSSVEAYMQSAKDMTLKKE